MKRKILSGLMGSLCMASSLLLAELPLWQQPAYQAAILKARAGQPATALAMLEQQRSLSPLRGGLLDDYLTLLCWSGRVGDALANLPADTSGLRIDTLSLLARSARDQHDYPLAVRLYQQLLQDQPSASHAALLAMSQAEAKQADAALHTLTLAEATASLADDVRELVRARAYVLAQSGNLTEALAYLQAQQRIYPHDVELDRILLDVQLRLGAALTADETAHQQQTVDPVLARQAGFDHAAVLSRWGSIAESQDGGMQRHAQTEAALALNQQLAAGLPASDSRFALLAVDDRLLMLDQRGMFSDVVLLYQRHGNVGLSPYALAAVADAYLSLRQAAQAIPLYQQAIKAAPQADELVDWRIGLVYALLEDNRFAACSEELASLRTAVPRQHGDAAGRQVFNPDYQRVMLLDAMVQAYQDRNREGWQKLDALLQTAPFNADLRQSQGALALLRGWPRLAGDIYRRLLVDDPASLEARAGLASAALDTWEYPQLPGYIAPLQWQRPDWKELETLQRRSDWAQRPELTVDIARDFSGGQGSGEQNAWESTSRLYSAPDDYWRLFVQHQLQRASFVGEPDSAHYEVAGMGAQYRSQQGNGEFGVLAGLDGQQQAGAFAAYHWTPDDFWTWGARYEQDSPDTPLKARLSDTRGNKLLLDGSYRQDDYRQFSLQISQLTLSDGNDRQAVAGSWSERWISGPVYKLESTLQLASSRNDVVPDALYFNPQSDREVDLTLMQDWRVWSHYDNSLHQRLGLTLGNYYEQNYGSGAVWGLMLEQEWRWSEQASLRYGYSRVRHPYDGQTDVSSQVYLNLDWHF